MGQRRSMLPILPKDILSQQQRLIYDLANFYSIKDISSITSIPEKQVRQVLSVIRRKWKDYANENVTKSIGAKHDYLFCSNRNCEIVNNYADWLEGENIHRFSESEIYVLNYINKGFSTKQISKLINKSEQSIRKMKQRLKAKISIPLIDFSRTVKEVDIHKEMIKVNKKSLLSAIQRSGLTKSEISNQIGIPEKSLKDMVESGFTSYHNLFLLMKCLNFNYYGPSEKEDLAKELSDPNWLASIRLRESEGSCQKSKLVKDKIRYRNRVMYYGTSYTRYSHCSGKLEVENGRNGLFPLVLNRQQREKCSWLLKKLMLRPVYVYKCPELSDEIRSLEIKLNKESEPNKIDKYKRKLLFLKESAVLEDSKALYIIRKDYLAEIQKALSYYDC